MTQPHDRIYTSSRDVTGIAGDSAGIGDRKRR
jgi:hypothetical protein